MVICVVVDVSWTVSPFSLPVTRTRYCRICPFLFSGSGGSHDRVNECVPVSLACRPSGADVGTEKEEKGQHLIRNINSVTIELNEERIYLFLLFGLRFRQYMAPNQQCRQQHDIDSCSKGAETQL